MGKILSLVAGGAIGTLLRYALSGATHKVMAGVFPWGTLVVNLTGSYVIGLLWGLFEIEALSPNARAFVFIGVLGGFTTFSTFTLESLNLLKHGEMKLALLNVLASNIMGVGLVIGGFATSRILLHLLR